MAHGERVPGGRLLNALFLSYRPSWVLALQVKATRARYLRLGRGLSSGIFNFVGRIVVTPRAAGLTLSLPGVPSCHSEERRQ